VIVRFTPPARAQLIAAVGFIRGERPSAALSFRAWVGEALAQLATFPESGPVIPEFPTFDFRQLLVDSYRVFYTVRGDVVWIVGVWRDAQMPDEPQDPGGG